MYWSVVLKPNRLWVCGAVNYTELRSLIPVKIIPITQINSYIHTGSHIPLFCRIENWWIPYTVLPRKTHLDLLPMSCWAHSSDLSWMSEALQLAHTHAFTDSLVFTFIRLQTCRHKKMPPMNPVISSKNYKVMVLTFNRNITLETYTILSIPRRWKRICLLCRNIYKGTSTPLCLWITIK